jgi:MFS family permease
MLYAAISNANLGIISQFASQNGNEWIGPLSIALVFLGSGIGALYNAYINKWPYRYIILAGSMGWNIFLSFSVMFLFIGFSNLVIAVILVGSLGCGFLMSAYYNGLNNYVNECGKRDNKTNSYFGINICINQCSNIIGNALSAILI